MGNRELLSGRMKKNQHEDMEERNRKMMLFVDDVYGLALRSDLCPYEALGAIAAMSGTMIEMCHECSNGNVRKTSINIYYFITHILGGLKDRIPEMVEIIEAFEDRLLDEGLEEEIR